MQTRETLFICFLLLLGSVLKAQYPPSIPGKPGYTIATGEQFLRTITNGATLTFIQRCDNMENGFGFRFPNPDPGGNNRTRMKFRLEKKVFGASKFKKVVDSGWSIYNEATVNAHAFSWQTNFQLPELKPLHQYRLRIITQREKTVFTNYWAPLSRRCGRTQSVNVGACENDCAYDLVLTQGNTFPHFENDGYYHPHYQSNSFIKASLNLSTGENLVLKAKDFVELNPGFDAQKGAIFEAWIAECD